MGYLNYAIKGIRPKNLYYISSLSLKDILRWHNPARSHGVHMKAAMEWLSMAQTKTNDGGVSALYSLFDGWAPSYVETTGYIIPTFFNYAELTKNPAYREKAIRMAEFELQSQLPEGAFPGGGTRNKPIVFNTGQVIFGLCRTFEETHEEKYKKAADKAARWLVSVMDEDGCWRKHEYLNHVHTYNTRTAWALLHAHKITKNDEFRKAARENIEWALTQQQENGWFRNNGFYTRQEPMVHTIAYTIRGILEAGIYLKKSGYVEAAGKAAASMAGVQRADGSLAGSFGNGWKSSVSWSCLTGNSQMAIIWLKLHAETKDQEVLSAAQAANAFMKRMQSITSSNAGIRGGIPGAYPIYGWYAPFAYPNWAAKFFVDALMLESNPEMHSKIT